MRWISLRRTFAVLATGCLVLAMFEWTRLPVSVAVALFFVGLMMLALRLLFYLQQVEPQYWSSRTTPPGLCPGCGYNLTGNTSGVCPECGWKVKPPRTEAQAAEGGKRM